MENAIWEFLEGVIDPTQAIVLLALVLGNVFTGILAAMLNGTFEASKVMEFYRRLGVVFISYIGVSVVATVLTDWSALQTAYWAFLIVQMGDKIFENLKKLGLPVPDHLPLVNRVVNVVGAPVRVILNRS